METQNYNCTFTVKNTPHEVFDAICRVSEWWSVNTEGSASHLDDVFTLRFGKTTVDFKITEMVPDKKITWLVTDCYLDWLNDKKEWKGTQLDFEITGTAEGTRMSMAHIGLVPGIECYNDCKKGWDFFAGDSLRKLITEHKGQPDMSKAERETAAV